MGQYSEETQTPLVMFESQTKDTNNGYYLKDDENAAFGRRMMIGGKKYNKPMVLVIGVILFITVVVGLIIVLGVSIGFSLNLGRKVVDGLIVGDSNEYLWIDSDVGMDDMFAMQVILIHLNRMKQENNSFLLSSLSSVYGMTPNATNGREIIGKMLKTNSLDGISSDRDYKIVKGANFGLKDNLEKFRFEDADWYSSVDQKQSDFLQEMNYSISNQEIDKSKEHEETYQFEPTFINYKNQEMNLESIPDHSLTILTLGPLTNIALWIRNNPSKLEIIKRKIKRVVSMGGNAIFIDNNEMTNPYEKEWNYHCDAKSVQIVMQTFTDKFFMIGLDVANEQAISPEQINNLQQLLLSRGRSSASHGFTLSLLSNLLTINPISCIYDPITASYLIHPELFTFEKVKVNVELQSSATLVNSFAGRIYNDSSNGITIHVANSFNNSMYYHFLHSLFSSL